MAPRGNTFRMADRLLDGKLSALLVQLRCDGLSWEEIARRLYGQGGVEVTAETLRRWHDDITALDAETVDASAPAPKAGAA